MIPDEKSRLRKIEHELYTTDIMPPNRRGVLHEKSVEAPEDWNETADSMHFIPVHHDHSIFKKIFFGSLIILIIAIGIFAASFFFGGNGISANKVDITVTAVPFADGGENFPVNVTIVNRNKLPIELATLSLEYPSTGLNTQGGMARIDRDVGTIDVGATHAESFDVQLYGAEGSAQNITAHMEFHISGSNVIYDKDQSASVTIRSSPINLTMTPPDQVLPNQNVPIQFSIVGNGTSTLSNTALVVQYPANFTFIGASPSPSTGNNVWYLGDVPPGVNRTITVNGSFAGGVNNSSTVSASVGSQNAQDQTKLDQVYNQVSQIIQLANAFVTATLQVPGSDASATTVPISATQSTQISIPWQNTTSSNLTNLEIHVALSGSAYDPSQVQAGSGFFNSTTNEIVWNSQQDGTLSSVAPGATGNESFSITPSQSSGGSNPSIVMTVSVQAVTAGHIVTAQNVDKKTLVIGSDLNLLPSTVYYTGPIQNTGAMPPVHDKETTYTVVLQLTNSVNRVTGIRVATTLPTNVDFKNVFIPKTAAVTYNTVTRELDWNAGELAPNATATVSIKVGVTPSTQQVGSQPALTGPINVVGHDTFTNTDISISRRSLTTQTLNDGPGAGADGQVK